MRSLWLREPYVTMLRLSGRLQKSTLGSPAETNRCSGGQDNRQSKLGRSGVWETLLQRCLQLTQRVARPSWPLQNDVPESIHSTKTRPSRRPIVQTVTGCLLKLRLYVTLLRLKANRERTERSRRVLIRRVMARSLVSECSMGRQNDS